MPAPRGGSGADARSSRPAGPSAATAGRPRRGHDRRAVQEVHRRAPPDSPPGHSWTPTQTIIGCPENPMASNGYPPSLLAHHWTRKSNPMENPWDQNDPAQPLGVQKIKPNGYQSPTRLEVSNGEQAVDSITGSFLANQSVGNRSKGSTCAHLWPAGFQSIHGPRQESPPGKKPQCRSELKENCPASNRANLPPWLKQTSKTLDGNHALGNGRWETTREKTSVRLGRDSGETPGPPCARLLVHRA